MSTIEENIKEKIRQSVENNKIMLYMKGTPDAPLCGFSAQVVQVLNSYGFPYGSANALESAEMRQGIKDFTNWPTIPQLFVNGKFIGGCDITMELHRRGELKGILEEELDA